MVSSKGKLMGKILKKLKLHGFNNLTKTLSFNIYDICYAKTPAARRDYIEYIVRRLQCRALNPDNDGRRGYYRRQHS